MLAVGGASKGNMFLLIFGLGLSIPLVVGTSSLLSMLMGKYPIIVIVGSAVLGKVAGEMITTDALVQKWFAIPPYGTYVAEAVFAVGVVVTGKLIMKRRKARKEAAGLPALEGEPGKAPKEDK
jgi:predicted tellurium resistance membrane protein TerC